VDNKFILISIPSPTGSILALIDQHAADERHRLEAILRSLPTSSYTLETPLQIPLSSRQLEIFRQRKDILMSCCGVQLKIEANSVWLLAVPEVLASDSSKDLNTAQWKTILLEAVSGSTVQCPAKLMSTFCSKACRSAIMFNDVLSRTECERIVRQLAECKHPFICAHGRPCIAAVAQIPS